jgi:hypothetical protein
MKWRFRKLLWVPTLVAGLASTASVTARELAGDSGFEKREARKETASEQHSDWLTRPRADLHEAGTRFLKDQKQIWLSPWKLRLSDTEWLVPLAGITSAMMLTDASLSKSLPSGPGTLHKFENIRTASAAGLPGSRDNVVAGLELGFLPQWGRRRTSPTALGSMQATQLIGESLP